jgi:hypothetical protein
MSAKLSRPEQTVAELLERVCELKQGVEAKKKEIVAFESELERFEAEYDIYVHNLQRQRQDLAERVQRYRRLLRRREEPEPPKQTRRPPPQQEPEPQPPPEEPPIGPRIEPLQPLDRPSEREKKLTRNFFAKFWHPDRRWKGACPDLGLMHQLDTAFEQSEDLVDLMIAIPWHDVWQQRGENEAIGMQWERLMHWEEALEQAGERLDQALAQLRQHEFHSLLLEKQAADERGEDYFAQLSGRELDEIARLENALAALERQWAAQLQAREAQEQGS